MTTPVHDRLAAARSASTRSLSPNPCPLSPPHAFTLIELLIVLGIITLVVALGIPLFGVLTGAKSVEAGRNVVAATIGQARTVAVNEGKYAGVLFYVDPATERTAMSLVIVTDPASSLEDPDPYDKYKQYVDRQTVQGTGPMQVASPAEQEYYSAKDAVVNNVRVRGDRVVRVTFDADNAYRSSLYGATPLVSDYLHYFGNYRPTVRAFDCRQTHTTASSNDAMKPPQNGPYGTWAGSPGTANFFTQYKPSTATPSGSPILVKRSTVGPFANNYWGSNNEPAIATYTASEQVLLPRGVGVQVMMQPLSRNDTPAFKERYLHTGLIMFDPQGRLTVLKPFQIRLGDPANPLGDYLGLKDIGGGTSLGIGARNIPAGVGVALYDTQSFLNAPLDGGYKTSSADWLFLTPTNNQYYLNSSFVNLFGDYPSASTNDEIAEEAWLDANASPLIVNRYTGALSEAE